MPEKRTIERARKDKREGKAPSTQAGEFVRQEMEHIRSGKHGARSTKQAIAIGLSEARRAGVKLPPRKGKAGEKDRRDESTRPHKKSAKRSRASENNLKREPRKAASQRSLSRQARSAASRRTAASRSASARKAARTRKSEGK